MRVDEQVARMHVGMEEAVAQRMAQEGLDHGAPSAFRSWPGASSGAMALSGDAVDPFHGQHVAGGAFPVDGGHAEARIVARVLGHLRKGRGLQPQVHLDA